MKESAKGRFFEDFAHSQLNFAPALNGEMVTFKNSDSLMVLWSSVGGENI